MEKLFGESGLVFLVAATRPAEALAGTLAKQTGLVKTCNGQPELLLTIGNQFFQSVPFCFS